MTTAAVSTGVAVAVSVAASGCSYWAPDVTAVPYAPADGLNAELPDLLVRNLIVVGDDADGTGLVVGTLVNQTDEDLTVELSSDTAGLATSVEVPADGLLSLTAPQAGDVAESPVTPERDLVTVSPVGVEPGATVAVQVVTPAAGAIVLEPPVALPEGPYAGFLDAVQPESGAGEPEPGGDPAGAEPTPAEPAPAPGGDPTAEPTA